jgi:hypothetical protein
MPFHRRLLTLVGILLGLGLATDARAEDPTAYPPIVPSLTDAAIVDTATPPGTRGNHLVWLAPPERRVGKLLVFLPSGGPLNIPSEFTELGSVAGRLGYHTVSLAYRNEAPVAALPPAGCGTDAAPSLTDPTCARDARLEILNGDPASSVVNVNPANSIENRLNKLLVYLNREHPGDGWGQFIDDPDGPNPQPVWSKTVIAGASLGAGEAAMIAAQHYVYRAALLHGWVDANHGWVAKPIELGGDGQTPSANYFTLIHAHDNFFERTCHAYKTLGLTPVCPLDGFTVPPAVIDPGNPHFIENLGDPPFGLQVHVFNLAPGATDGGGDIYHQSTTRNHWIAKEADGITPSHILVNAWSSVLGDETDGDGIRNLSDNCPGTVNATQADADHDGIGDVCDPTPQGTVPPTIAVPGPITVNATGPSGATVPYTVTVTDDLPSAPAAVCAPLPGSLFAIGNTTIACTATDAGGNTATAGFTVTVLGAKEQLADLIRKVIDSTKLSAAIKTQLIASLQSLIAGFDPNKPLQRAAACLKLRAFTTLIQFVAPLAHRAEWTADANRIRAVLAC